MTTKLLKKVRKDFSIVDYPNGRLDDIGEVWPAMYCVMRKGSIVADHPYSKGIEAEKKEAFEKAWLDLKEFIHYLYDTKKHKAKKKTITKAKYPAKKVWPPEIQPVTEKCIFPKEEGGGLVAW